MQEIIKELRSKGKLMNRIADKIEIGALTIGELAVICNQFGFNLNITKNENTNS